MVILIVPEESGERRSEFFNGCHLKIRLSHQNEVYYYVSFVNTSKHEQYTKENNFTNSASSIVEAHCFKQGSRKTAQNCRHVVQQEGLKGRLRLGKASPMFFRDQDQSEDAYFSARMKQLHIL